VAGLFRIRRSVDIHFAHHIRGHDGACINLHGHTWKFEIGVEADELDEQGFVIDFARIRAELLTPCYQLLDHALAIGELTFREVESDLASLGEKLLSSRAGLPTERGDARVDLELSGARTAYPGGMKVTVFPFSPTSERLAEWLYSHAASVLDDERVRVSYGRIYETLHPVESVAEYSPRR
jgi:6-pyruvoyltetrahydropterin/6-carboxytetrahydropterin synthase